MAVQSTKTTLVHGQNRVAGSFYRRYGKRLLDFIFALCGLVILSPLMLVVALLVWLELGSPVIFKQKRPGLNERIFTMYKFRTMTDEKDDNGELLPDEDRLTGFGRFLRATSLDELPELYNILIGDMSFVGPRPQLVRDMVFMTPEQRRCHMVLPGLTGWAQVNGRNEVDWHEKLSLDLDYIEQITFVRDVRIIIMTFVRVLRREGVTTCGYATAEDLGDYLLRVGAIDERTYQLGLLESARVLSAAED